MTRRRRPHRPVAVARPGDRGLHPSPTASRRPDSSL